MLAATWVFIHGWGSDSSIWSDLIDHLQQPCECLNIPVNTELASEESLAECLDSLAQQLPQKCVLVGWSLGGMLATQLAARRPDQVCALVTLATNPRFVASDDWPAAMAPEVFNVFYQQFTDNPTKTVKRFRTLQVQGDSARSSVVARLQNGTARIEDNPLAGQLCLSWLAQMDNREILAGLKCRQWHLFGAEDALVPRAAASAIEQQLGVPTEVIAGVAHLPHVSQPQRLARQLTDWFNGFCEPDIPKQNIADSFSLAATRYDQHAHLQRRVAQDLLSKLPKSEPGISLDLGCGTGFIGAGLLAEGRQVVGLDIAAGMLAQARHKHADLHVCGGDLEALPFLPEQFDQVVSSLSLQWCSSLRHAAEECFRVLRPSGVWAFSTLVDGSLWELKQAWSAADDFVHVNTFQTSEVLVDQVREAGFNLLQVSPLTVTMTFSSVMELLRELKAIGAHNMNAGRNRKLTTPAVVRAMESAYSQWKTAAGEYPATYQVLFVLAQKPRLS